MKNCVFCKIAKHEMPKEFEYEDDDLMVFPDINPSKEVHVLIVPKKHLEDFMKLNDSNLMVKIFEMVQKMIKKHNLTDKGYRVLFNGGGAQAIDHLHVHIIGPLDKAYRI